ncbi:MAG: hypothetical protein ACJA1B_002748 [Polaribacter sp.]|jgi:hypothetical protein
MNQLHPQTEKWFSEKEREINERRNDEFFLFIKQILVLSTSLMGLALAFHKFVENKNGNLFLTLSIILFLCNILLALIVLHGKIRNLDNLRKGLRDKKQEMVENIHTSRNIASPFDKGVVYAAKALYVSFFLSVLSLCLYGFFSINTSKEDSLKEVKKGKNRIEVYE